MTNACRRAGAKPLLALLALTLLGLSRPVLAGTLHTVSLTYAGDSGFTPNPVAPGQSASAALSASIDSDPQTQSEDQLKGPAWGWQIVKVTYQAPDGSPAQDVTGNSAYYSASCGHPDASIPDAGLDATFLQIGGYVFTLKMTVDYSDPSNGDTWHGEGTGQVAESCSLDATFTGGLTNNTVRACAGAIPDGVHEDAVTIQATLSGNGIPNEALTVSFDNSVDYTGCKPPQLIDDQNGGKLVSTLTRTTDAQGNIHVTVLSSDLISTPKLLVSFGKVQIGSTGCDFEIARSIRRYGIISYDPNDGYKTDTGWDFSLEGLITPGDITTATLFLKFQKDPQVPIDDRYYWYNNSVFPSMDVNGDGIVSDDEYYDVLPRGFADYLLNDASNWLAVSGHQLHVKITQITDFTTGATITDPKLIQNYVFFSNAQGVPIDVNGNPFSDPNNFMMPDFVPSQTVNDGTATVYLTAGVNIYACSNVVLEAVDETQVGGDGNF